MNKLMYSTIVLSLLGVASAGPVQVSYTLNLGSGTINGNNLTNIAILEESGGSVHLDYSFSGPESGVFTLSHMVDSLPEESLIVGLDFPSTTGGDDKTHVVFFTNSDFVASSDGKSFQQRLPWDPAQRLRQQRARGGERRCSLAELSHQLLSESGSGCGVQGGRRFVGDRVLDRTCARAGADERWTGWIRARGRSCSERAAGSRQEVDLLLSCFGRAFH